MAYERIQINENTWRFEDNKHVRFFLLTGRERALLIDSGLTVNNAGDLARELTDLPVDLLNTHGDRDHVGSNAQFEKFYMHPDEADNYYNTQHMTGEFIPLADGDAFDLGNRPLEIIALPGHTPGSIAVLDVNARVLYSGDPIQTGMIFMFGKQRDMKTYRESLKKLDAYRDRFDILYPAHGAFPVEPSLIDELYEVSGKLENGSFPSWPMEVHGRKVKCVDVGVAKYLLPDEANS